MAGDFVGGRVREFRTKRGLSRHALATTTGLSNWYLTTVEAGLRPVDRRTVLIRLADALQVSAVDLTGQPFPPAGRQHARALAAVPDIRVALNGLAPLDPPAWPSRTLPELHADLRRLMLARRTCEYADAAHLIPGLVRDLGAGAYVVTAGRTRRAVLKLLTLATYHAAFVVTRLGFVDLALAAAERCHDAARELDDAAYLGLADHARLHTLPPESHAIGRRLATVATDRLDRGGSSELLQAYGTLHLANAWSDAVAGDGDGVAAHLAEAADVARRLGGDPPEGGFADLQFGPAAVALARVSLQVELGSPGRAVALARALDPARLTSPARRAALHVSVGSALAASRRRDAASVAEFLRAEQAAPQRVRLCPVVRDTVAVLLRRARANGDDRLGALAARIGAGTSDVDR